MEIYRSPTNLFVAKFVGNPPINVIERNTSSSLFSNVDLILKDRVHGGVEFIAFRPEFVHLISTSAEVDEGHWHRDVAVTSIQPTGPEWIVQVGHEENRFLLRLDREPAKMEIGDVVRIMVAAADILAYDKDEQLIVSKDTV
jgi:ABC-type sugar transport system ATPase subunit